MLAAFRYFAHLGDGRLRCRWFLGASHDENGQPEQLNARNTKPEVDKSHPYAPSLIDRRSLNMPENCRAIVKSPQRTFQLVIPTISVEACYSKYRSTDAVLCTACGNCRFSMLWATFIKLIGLKSVQRIFRQLGRCDRRKFVSCTQLTRVWRVAENSPAHSRPGWSVEST